MAKLFSFESDERLDENQEEHLRDENTDTDIEVRDFSAEEYDFDIYNSSITNAVSTLELAQESIDLLDKQDINGKNYLIIYDNVSRYFKSISRNLNTDVVIPSMESIAISRTREGVHKLSMEGFMDVIRSIWEKIKSFFSSLWKKIVLFFKRLVGAEPDFEHLDRYIEEGIRKIEKDNKVCSNPAAKVETMLPMYLSSPDSKEYSVDLLFTSGENKIKNFRLILDEVDLKIDSTVNQFKTKNNSYIESLRKIVNVNRSLKTKISELLKTLKEQLKLENPRNKEEQEIKEKIAENLLKIETAFNIYREAVDNLPNTEDNLRAPSEIISLLISRPADIAGSFNLTEVNPSNLPYLELNDLVNEMKNNAAVKTVKCAAKYNINGGSFSTNNVANLNIVLISTEPAIDNNTDEITDNTLDNFSFDMDLRVFKYLNEYVAKNMPVLSKKQDLTRAHNLYKIIKIFNVEKFKNSFIKLESANSEVDKLMDEVINELRELIKIYNEIEEILKIARDYLQNIVNSEYIDEANKNNITNALTDVNNRIAELLETKSYVRKMEIFYVKATKHMKGSISQLGSSVAKDLSEIRYNLLKELGYYIYRSIKTYS